MGGYFLFLAYIIRLFLLIYSCLDGFWGKNGVCVGENGYFWVFKFGLMGGMNDMWRMPDDAFELLDEKAVEFIFSQGEKMLDEECKVSSSTTNRCYALASIIVAVCPLLVSSALSIHNGAYTILVGLLFLLLMAACLILVSIMKPRYGYGIGKDPKTMAELPVMRHYKETGSKFYPYYFLTEIQMRIEETEKDNVRRNRLFSIALYIVVLSICLFVPSALFFI